MSTTMTEEETTVQSPQEIPVLGYAISWALPQEKRYSIPKLRKIVRVTLGKDYVPQPPTQQRALLRALKDEGIEYKALRLLQDSPDEVRYDNLQPKQKRMARLGYDHQLIRLDKATDEVTVTAKGAEPEALQQLAEALTKGVKRYRRVLMTADVRLFLSAYIRDNYGVPLRGYGGFYYLPEWSVPALQGFFTAINGQLYTLPIANNPLGQQQMANLVLKELDQEIDEITATVERLLKKKSKRGHAFVARKERLEGVERKMGVYDSLLNSATDLVANSNSGANSAGKPGLTAKFNAISKQVDQAILRCQHRFGPVEAKFPLQSRVRYLGTGSGKANQSGTVIGYTVAKSRSTRYFSKTFAVRVLFDGGEDVIAVAPRFLEPLD